ncbi:MAG: recombinase family protein, partial [Burkholderiaceae bacterium]
MYGAEPPQTGVGERGLLQHGTTVHFQGKTVNTTAMHWAYVRVSTEEQLDGQSVDSQIRRCVEAGIPRDHVVVEVASASKAQTKELFKLFTRARKGEVRSILATRQDRFARSRKVQAQMWQLIDDHKVRFRFLDQADLDPSDPQSTFMFSMMGAMSVYETEQLSQRVKNSLEENRLRKKHHGPAPWGYRASKGVLYPRKGEWELAQKVVAEYLKTGNGEAARKVRLLETGKTWSPSSFSKWITAPVLRGAVSRSWDEQVERDGIEVTERKSEIFWGCHEPLISPAQWDSIAEIRRHNLRTGG